VKRVAATPWWWVALAGAVLLPWHMQQDGLGLRSLLALFQDDPEAASAASQAVRHGASGLPVLRPCCSAPAALRWHGLRSAAAPSCWRRPLESGGDRRPGLRDRHPWLDRPWLEVVFRRSRTGSSHGIGGAVAAVGFLFQASDG
jgi:hypothetical protein